MPKYILHLLRACFVFPVLFISLFSCKGQAPAGKIAGFLKTKGDSIFKAEQVNGIFIGVLNNGTREYYNFGFADLAAQRPFDSTTIFEIGSITKTFTSYVLYAVLNEKKIPDTSSILSFLPDTVQGNKALANTSFLQLVNHTAGFERLPSNMLVTDTDQLPYDNYSIGQYFTYLQSYVPKPDGKSNYSNSGAALAGILAQRISGKSYEALLDQYIFTPLKFTSSQRDIKTIANKAQGYFGDNSPTPYWNMKSMAPAGGLKMSAAEILTYLGFMAASTSDSTQLIREQVTTPSVTVSETMKVARAWHILTMPSLSPIYFHDGGTYGFTCFAAFIKGQQKAVIVVTNKFGSRAAQTLALSIMKRL